MVNVSMLLLEARLHILVCISTATSSSVMKWTEAMLANSRKPIIPTYPIPTRLTTIHLTPIYLGIRRS